MDHKPQVLTPPTAERARLSLDLSPQVALLLDHVATVLGVPKSQLVTQALVEALPAFLERAEGLQKRAQVLQAGKGGKR